MSISIWDYEKPLDAMMLNHDHMAALVSKHEQQIKDLAAHLLELRQLVTPMMEFKQPTKICGPNLEETLNATGFYRKKEWVGLTGDEIEDLPKDKTWWEIIRAAEEILKEKNT